MARGAADPRPVLPTSDGTDDTDPRFAELNDWKPVLDRLGLSVRAGFHIAARARRLGVSFVQELRAAGLVDDTALCQAVADEIGIAALDRVNPDALSVRDREARMLLGTPVEAVTVSVVDFSGRSVIQALDRMAIDRLRMCVRLERRFGQRMKIATPSALREALLVRFRTQLAGQAVGRLWHRRPDCSARFVLNAWQGFAAGILVVAIPTIASIAPLATVLGIHLASTLFYLACGGVRLAAARHAAPVAPYTRLPLRPGDMPVYSVLVALYKEAEIVPQLLVALGKLDWPRSKLEVKLICEADDSATLAAIRAHQLRSNVEVIEVPDIGPRTKPKALGYALPATSGALIVLYDAEDRPHPQQLIEAWQTFQTAPPEVACLQAPLIITNDDAGPIPRLFAVEYAALFRGLLPWLASRRLVLPLGGTSNHFRRTALLRVGGWDPYNVTEDADLGVRLARFGYRAETLRSPTLEDAPETVRRWFPQRSRWLKGWLQTWLVHMRHPATLLGEIGLGSFLIVQLLFAGVVVSALVHPVIFVSALWIGLSLLLGANLTAIGSIMLVLDGVSILLGYVSFLLLASRALPPSERPGLWKVIVFLPVYWLLMSAAAWRAVHQLIVRPHHWSKTDHTPQATTGGRAAGPVEV